jgi:hypothetical protein
MLKASSGVPMSVRLDALSDPTAAHEVHNQRNNGQNQQQMDQAASYVKHGEPEKPNHEQNREDRHQHV